MIGENPQRGSISVLQSCETPASFRPIPSKRENSARPRPRSRNRTDGAEDENEDEDDSTAHTSRAFMVIFAFSSFEIGQLALAFSAASSAAAVLAPGIASLTSR